MIHIKSLSFAYPDAPTVLTDISVDIAKGALVVLAGANGSGKSSLLGLLAGIYAPTSGTLKVGEATSPGQEKALRSLCGLLLQDADLQILGGTVREDMLMGADAKDTEAKDKARALAARFGLADLWQHPVQTLSWGQKRKLCLAATLMHDPSVLLLDEPFSGLDYPGQHEMRALLEDNHKAGLTQIVVSHDLAPLADLADMLLVLHQGSLALSGSPDDVLASIRQYGVRPPGAWLAGQGLIPWE